MTEQRIQRHKFVEFRYSIQDEAGNVLEQIDLPVSYVHSADSGMLEKLEQALEGHAAGDDVSVTLSPQEGFGPHRPELTFTDDVDNVPEQFRFVGAQVEMQNDRGEVKTFSVSKIAKGKLTVDGNHPLAGKVLTFTLNILSVRDATPQEIEQGRPKGEMLLH